MGEEVRATHEIDASQRSVRELVTDLTTQLSRLLRAEIRLAQRELAHRGKQAGLGLGLLGAGAVAALFGGGALVATVILALALVLPAWAAALIIGAALTVVGAALAAVGLSLVKRQSPVPTDALDSARQDVDVIRHAVAHGHERSSPGEPERRAVPAMRSQQFQQG